MASTPVQNGYNNKDFVDKNTVNLPKPKQISALEKSFIMPNGYKISPKISLAPKTAVIDKASIDYHLENFIMNRKIALNGGSELRINDSNISLHLNNALVTYASQQQQLKYENAIKGNFNNSSSLPRSKRPHSIAVEPQLERIKSKDENSNFPANSCDVKQREPPHNAFYSTTQKNSERRSVNSPTSSLTITSQESDNYSLSVPASTHSNSKVPPAIPQRRAQSIPRQNATSNTPPVLRPKSLDRQTHMTQQQPIKRLSQPGLPNMRISNGPGMRQSVTFHGQLLDQGVIYSNMNELAAKNVVSTDGKQPRPVSFAYGTVPDQAFLENQLRIYSEQLRTITESVKRYSEQAKLLQELKKQQQQHQQQNGNHSKSLLPKQHPALQPLQTPPPGDVVDEEVQTPSHQLKLFLESIRSSMREPETNYESYDDDDDGDEEGVEKKVITDTVEPDKTVSNVDSYRKESSGIAKTPSDQLRQFLDAIRSNQPNTNETDFNHSCGNISHSKIVDNARTINAHATVDEINAKTKAIKRSIDCKAEPKNGSEPFDSENQDKLAINIAKTSKTVDQILDKFHLLAMNAKSADSVEYLKKCSDALKQTSEQIRLFNMAYGGNTSVSSNGTAVCTSSSDDTSCSTTPGSIREAVQNLLQQPRNGFQIMDDRMSLFIDILDTQDRFSQVYLLG